MSGVLTMIDLYVLSAKKRPKTESTNALAVVRMLTQDVPNTSMLFALQLFIPIKSVQLLCAALQVYSTRIASTFSLPQAIKRRLVCYIASTWKDFCVVSLTRMPITCTCCSKLKVHYTTRPWISEIDHDQVSTSFSTNAKQSRHTIRPSCSLIKSSSPNVTEAEHLYSANQRPTSSPTPRTTSGAQQLRRRPKGRSQVIIELLLLEVRLHSHLYHVVSAAADMSQKLPRNSTPP